MTQVAIKMMQACEHGFDLVETIDEDEIHSPIRKTLPTPEHLTDVAQTSLLTPASIRTTAAPLRLRFSHYSLHEFYVAKAIREGTLNVEGRGVPEGVQNFLTP